MTEDKGVFLDGGQGADIFLVFKTSMNLVGVFNVDFFPLVMFSCCKQSGFLDNVNYLKRKPILQKIPP